MVIYPVISFVISATAIPIIIKLCNQYKIYDSINARKVHTGNIPRLGSVGFVLSFCIVSIAFFIVNKYDIHTKIFTILFSGIIIFLFGVFDDIKEQRGIIKLLVQSIVAIIVIIFGYRFHNVFGINLGFFSYPLTYIWIVGMINSFNLIDGVDALCGGLSVFILCTLGIIFYGSSLLLSTLCFILVGSLLGFLLYNKPKAKIFMGDGGSQFLGFIVGVLPLYKTDFIFEQNKLAMITLLAAIPIFDTIAAVWRRTREHRSFFDADKSHLHHKLINLGYKTKSILLLLYGIQVFLCVLVIVATYIGFRRGTLVLFLGFCAMSIFFTIIHYTNMAVNKRLQSDFHNELDDD